MWLLPLPPEDVEGSCKGVVLGSCLKEEIHLTDLEDLFFLAGNRMYTGFQGLYSACTIDVDRRGFPSHNELYELCKRRSLNQKDGE